ncbi:uncharacterized protein V6R79_021339 [Siganus canaliculatus]
MTVIKHSNDGQRQKLSVTDFDCYLSDRSSENMVHECQILLDSNADSKVWKQATQTIKHNSKLPIAMLLLLSLSAAVLIFNSHAKDPGQDENTTDLHHALRQISNVRAAMHLQGQYNPDMKSSVEWKNEVDQSHTQGGLKLVNNTIPMVHLSHSVRRWSKTYGNNPEKKSYETILHSLSTACQKTANSSKNEDWFSTLYMGAVFSLYKGDLLMTVMDEKMLPHLEDEPGKTFFGVFAL